MVDGWESLLTTYVLYPNYQWMIYWPTFGSCLWQLQVNIPFIDPLGFSISKSCCFLVKSQQVHPANARPLLWSSGSWRKKSHKNFQSGVGPPPNRNNEKLHRNAGPKCEGLLVVKMKGDVMRWGCNVWQFDLTIWRWLQYCYSLLMLFYLSVLNCLGTSSSIFALSTQIII